MDARELVQNAIKGMDPRAKVVRGMSLFENVHGIEVDRMPLVFLPSFGRGALLDEQGHATWADGETAEAVLDTLAGRQAETRGAQDCSHCTARLDCELRAEDNLHDPFAEEEWPPPAAPNGRPGQYSQAGATTDVHEGDGQMDYMGRGMEAPTDEWYAMQRTAAATALDAIRSALGDVVRQAAVTTAEMVWRALMKMDSKAIRAPGMGVYQEDGNTLEVLPLIFLPTYGRGALVNWYGHVLWGTGNSPEAVLEDIRSRIPSPGERFRELVKEQGT